MRRVLLGLLITIAVLVVAMLSIVGVRVAGADALPPTDPARMIVFDDGSSMPLGELLDRARRGLPLSVRPPTMGQTIAIALGGKLMANPHLSAEDMAAHNEPFGELDPDPIYALAEQNRVDGKLDQALALYLSIPPESEHYARARRLVAWNILARERGAPAQAVRFAHEAVTADPFDANAWHDCCRVYARTLGLPVH